MSTYRLLVSKTPRDCRRRLVARATDINGTPTVSSNNTPPKLGRIVGRMRRAKGVLQVQGIVQPSCENCNFGQLQENLQSGLWNGIRGVILPRLNVEVGYIPIARFKYTLLQDAFKCTPSISANSEDAGGTSQFKVVANKHNSILGEVGHSGGSGVSRVYEQEKLIGRASTSQPGAGIEDKGDREKAEPF
ncbi:hypothetical protein AAF712_012516 [Marasmius tenuissimus]|uniref:Uncharacterized protein n=1 Tax=Marasmius tenuissimus TaxID=585030 RepID=A0ABR2ZIX5_9AGAR